MRWARPEEQDKVEKETRIERMLTSSSKKPPPPMDLRAKLRFGQANKLNFLLLVLGAFFAAAAGCLSKLTTTMLLHFEATKFKLLFYSPADQNIMANFSS